MPKKALPKKKLAKGTSQKIANGSRKLTKAAPKRHRRTKKTAEEANRSNSTETSGTAQKGSSPFPADFQAMEHAVEVEHERLKIFQTVLRYRQLVASGDESGLILLVEMARLSCMALEFSEVIQTKMVHEAMRDAPAWPIIWMPDKKRNEALIERANHIGLSSNARYEQKASTAMRGLSDWVDDPRPTPRLIAERLMDMMISLRAFGAMKLQNDESMRRQKQLVDDYATACSSMKPQEASEKIGGDLKQCMDVFRRSVQAKEELNRLLVQELNQTMLFFFGFFKKPVDARLVEQHVVECMKLPDPTPDSKSAWLAVARNIFSSMTDNAPHRVPEYRHLMGNFKDYISPGQPRKQGDPSESEMRKWIVDCIKQAFEGILNLQSVPQEAKAGKVANR